MRQTANCQRALNGSQTATCRPIRFPIRNSSPSHGVRPHRPAHARAPARTYRPLVNLDCDFPAACGRARARGGERAGQIAGAARGDAAGSRRARLAHDCERGRGAPQPQCAAGERLAMPYTFEDLVAHKRRRWMRPYAHLWMRPDAHRFMRGLNRIGDRYGCHTCGTSNPGTKSRNWVGDHQDPNAINASGRPQRRYPHCMRCSLRQGGFLRHRKLDR